ncbi:MAG: hypothetical protein AAF655_18485 [Bacteroidota bacterium]
MAQTYKITSQLTRSDKQILEEGQIVSVNQPKYLEQETISIAVESVKEADSLTAIVTKDLNKIIQAIKVALGDASSKARFLIIGIVYLFLTPSGMAIFFIRGWRFDLIKRMLSTKSSGLAPEINSLTQIGIHVKEGIKIFGARAVYEIPKIIVLAAIGYSHWELVFDWTQYLLGRMFSPANAVDFSTQIQTTQLSLGITFMVEFVFYLILSFVITPAYKLTEIRYASGQIPYKSFFSMSVLQESYKLYKKYRFSTLTMYIWDIIISILSTLVAFITFIILPFISFLVLPFYKLIFKHLAKAYGYGVLARRLQANGDLPDQINIHTRGIKKEETN